MSVSRRKDSEGIVEVLTNSLDFFFTKKHKPLKPMQTAIPLFSPYNLSSSSPLTILLFHQKIKFSIEIYVAIGLHARVWPLSFLSITSFVFLDNRIKYRNQTFYSTFVYVEPDKEKRKPVWDKLSELASLRNDMWFLIGDFNEILCNEEKEGGPLRPQGSFSNFRTFVAENDLVDIKHSGNCLSWRGKRNTHLIFCRLDRAMANEEWCDRFPTARSEYLRLEGSDHRPIVTFFALRKRKQNRIFRFDRSLNKHPKISKLIKKAWREGANKPVNERLKRCKIEIQKWHRTHHQNNQQLLERAKGKLDEVLSVTHQNEKKIAHH